jgi:hypothetical protein
LRTQSRDPNGQRYVPQNDNQLKQNILVDLSTSFRYNENITHFTIYMNHNENIQQKTYLYRENQTLYR